MKTKSITLITLIMMVIVSSFATGCAKESDELSYVTISTNPEVELVVDDNSTVIALNGLNDDGKMLLTGEDFIGMDVESVVEEIIKLTEQLGFTISSEESNGKVNINVTISSSSDDLKKIVETKVQGGIQRVITDLELDATLVYLQSKKREYFEEIVLAYDPTLTEEEVQQMTYQQLLECVKDATLEKKEFITVALQDYYEYLKQTEFKLKYKQELSNALSSSYQELKESYNNLLQFLNEKIDELKTFEVNYFVDENSVYVKAVNEYNKAKEELMMAKVELATAEKNNKPTEILKAKIALLEKSCEFAEVALNETKEIITSAFAVINNGLEDIYNQLSELEKTFPESIDFEEKLTIAEDYINNSKDKLFEKFEETFSSEKIKEIEDEVKARKQEILDNIRKSKQQ